MKSRRQLPSPLAMSLPRRLPWRERTTEQRLRMILQAGIQLGLLVVALYDLRKRPADQVRGLEADMGNGVRRELPRFGPDRLLRFRSSAYATLAKARSVSRSARRSAYSVVRARLDL